MYEIWEERLVGRDGAVAENLVVHKARIVGDGSIELHVGVNTRGSMLHIAMRDDDDVSIKVTDLRAAIRDLVTLLGLDDELPSAVTEANERAAEIVERVCEALGDTDPYRSTLANDLRSTVLQLSAPPA